MQQHTVRKSVSFEGIGLHSGKRARIVLSPAPPDSGILFRAGGGDPIPAAAENVVDSQNATTVGRGGVRIQTVEHLLAAAAGLGIDNVEVQVDGPEIPAADGSARPFVALLASAGRAPQGARRRSLRVPHPIRVGAGARWLHVLPSDRLRISYTLDHPHPAIGTQAFTCEPTERFFVDEVAPARTYGLLQDLGFLRKNGLARGVSLDNAVGLGKERPLNPLRFPDEFVRHKVLDLLGDLALLGRPLLGHIVARNGGHALNHRLVVAMQRAVGLERRAVGAAVETAPGARVPALQPVRTRFAAL
jgi:UDP-3-O-[3-hydroxymyristoyl] N-acetylglucosamine deacetylase